ncbi:hypothetical protein C2S53_015233 [Perilla frutescens var. hirtella]|uniref:Pentatricopeptide repeat-containing protein n=1 Tax=Perilla frutescens var. hirtella TaxID=608512 RepID=A0AAD4NZQ6_PERFH|nr:hypothetical protein C2S53_015233 [Perilla frutescens var. hirtella]
MRASAMALIPRIIAGELATFTHPFSLFCSNFRNVGYEGRRHFSSMLRIDFSSVNDIQFASFLFREMIRIRPQPSVAVFNKLLTVVIKMDCHSAALSMFDEMRASGIPLNEYTFSIIIHCYCLQNRVDIGFAILGSFFKLGYNPDVATFTTLIKGLFLDDKAVEAEKLFKKLLDHKICEPNDVMIANLTNGLCKAGSIRTACYYLELLAKMGYSANVYAYTTVIDSLWKGGMVEDALWLFRKMIVRGIFPDVITYTSMIHGLCRAGRWEDMLDLLHEMINQKLSLKAVNFNVFVNILCKKGMVKEGEDLVEIMMQQNVNPDIFTCFTLIDGYCLQGQMDRAKELLDSLADKGLKPDIFSYGSLMDGYCKGGKVNEAWHIFLEVHSKGLQHTTSTYNIMIQGLLREGRFGDGWKLFNDMEAQGVQPDLFTYNILLDGLCKAHQIDDAISLVHTMEERGVNPDTVTYDILISGLCNEGRVDLARDILNQLPSKGGSSSCETNAPDKSTWTGWSKIEQIDDESQSSIVCTARRRDPSGSASHASTQRGEKPVREWTGVSSRRAMHGASDALAQRSKRTLGGAIQEV